MCGEGDDHMAMLEKDLDTKKLDAVFKMREMAQSAMKKKGISSTELRKMVGIKRYER